MSEKQTVGHFLEHWLEDVAESRVRPSTHASYKWIVKKHLIPGLGKVRLTKLSPQALHAFLNVCLKEGRLPLPNKKEDTANETEPQASTAVRPPGLSARTVQHIHATLRTALDQAVKWNLVARNVAMLVDAPPVTRQEVKPFSLEEARKFLEAVRDDRLQSGGPCRI